MADAAGAGRKARALLPHALRLLVQVAPLALTLNVCDSWALWPSSSICGANECAAGDQTVLVQVSTNINTLPRHLGVAYKKQQTVEPKKPWILTPATKGQTIGIALVATLAAFTLVSFKDFHTFEQLRQKSYSNPPSREPEGEEQKSTASPQPRSIFAILCLTSYRFYTGFMSATWLPYLLAMEGSDLWQENQALFMGVVKLLYGLSILLNPLFGLLGDSAAAISYSVGRRLFMRMGIIMAGVGILCCHLAAPLGLFKTFFFGIVVWRVGEGLNDVTSEAICPEMLPKEQFEVSSAIRASMFLVGGLLGYVMVAVFAHLHYSWLYFGYLGMMLLCGIPTLMFIDTDVPNAVKTPSRDRRRFVHAAVEAYLKPSRFEGGFPRACLCIFLFSCGTAPMFFILLMIRDLVGISDQKLLHTHFSLVSIDFFLSAAVAAALNALAAPPKGRQNRNEGNFGIREQSFHMTAVSVVAFGISAVIIPLDATFTTLQARARAFYVFASLLGATFGSVYSRFQDCNWQLLPPNVETANAMGYSTMWKLLGAGLGNFGVGLVLDFFQTTRQVAVPSAHRVVGSTGTTMISYTVNGYIALCTISAVLAWIAGVLVLTIPKKAASASFYGTKQAAKET